MKMVSLKRTAAEKREEAKEYSVGSPAVASGPDYPYGLCLNINDETIDKLGLGDDLPEVGEEFTVTARGVVTAVRQSATDRGDDSKSVEIQLTSIALDPAKGPSIRKSLEKAARGK